MTLPRDPAEEAVILAGALGAVDTVVALGSDTTGAIAVGDQSLGATTTVTLTKATTITLPTGRAGGRLVLQITQDATGSRVATWAAQSGQAVKFAGGAASGGVLSTAANAVDVAAFDCYDGVNWIGRLTKAVA